MTTLRELLNDWHDQKLAMYELAFSLGLMREGDFKKRVFWTNNPVSKALHEFLLKLVEAGILERREASTDAQFRWNPNFRGTWK